MKGRYKIRIENKNIRYDLEIVRNITIVRGDSATGKTTLIEMIMQYENDGENSGIVLYCEKKCTVLTGLRWKENLTSIDDSIVFIDENDRFITSEDFASAVKSSNNYFVIITRDNLHNLPYSVEEIYGIHESGKYAELKKTYNEFYRIYSDTKYSFSYDIDRIITEDSNSGYQFISTLAKKKGIECISAAGKSNIYAETLKDKNRRVLIFADGAAFGSEMNRITELSKTGMAILLYLPESFEWLILRSGLIDGRKIAEILEHPEDHIDSSKYFSWERFFTSLLIDETKSSYFRYSKERLNDRYLDARERKAITNAMGKVGEVLS